MNMPIENLEKENADLKAKIEQIKAQIKLEEKNIQLIHDMVKQLDKEGITTLSRYTSSDCVVHYSGGRDVHGLEAIIAGSSQFQAAFPDMSHSIEDIIAQGDLVAIRYTVKGTHNGEFRGIPPTGKQLTGSMMEFCRISNGKIIEWWQEADQLTLMTALGYELKLKEKK